jgi:hypothetical protein
MHFFNIATNLTNGPFMIGYEDDLENFYLKGETVGNRPQVSCRIFDSKGRFLFSMFRNRLSRGEEKQFRIESEADRLVVTDDEGHTLLEIETRDEAGRRVTYIGGQFFDKNGRLAARGDERGLLVNCPLRM